MVVPIKDGFAFLVSVNHSSMGNCPPHNLMEFRTSPVGYTRNSFAFAFGLFELTILDYRKVVVVFFLGVGSVYIHVKIIE